VTSRTIHFTDGTTKTPGFMLPGYEEWLKVEGGESFEVPGSAHFKLNILSPTDYCCSFLR